MAQFIDPDMALKVSLINSRIITLFGDIDEKSIRQTIERIIFLSSISTEDISIYINSHGGSVWDGLALVDVMRLCDCDINTVCIGRAASMASLILAAGTKGKRIILPHASVMIHQIYTEHAGTISELKTDLKEVTRLEDSCDKLLAEFTGKSFKQIKQDQKQDFWMNAEEAKKYGIVDDIVTRLGHFAIPKRKRKKRKKQK